MGKPAWLEIAEKEIGQKEIVNGDNPRILEYHSTTTLHAKHDEVPWCSSFVNWCLLAAGIVGTNNALASSWLQWGREISSPELGCICIIRQRNHEIDSATGSATGYHVAFWMYEAAGRIGLLGGNQSDQVKVSSFGMTTYEIMGYRMPREEA